MFGIFLVYEMTWLWNYYLTMSRSKSMLQNASIEWRKRKRKRGGVKGSYDFMMCQQNAPGETASGHTFYAQRISIFRMHRGWGPRLRLQSPSAHSHSLDFRARLSAAQKRIHKEFQDVSLNIFGFKADLNEHSTMSVHVFDHCSCPCVSVTSSSLHNLWQRLACCKRTCSSR